MKVLFIEDNMDAIKGICDYVHDNGWEYSSCDFEKAEEKIAVFDPEIIVMDWMYDAENIDSGKNIFIEVYKSKFRPIIIFSAVAGTIDLLDDITNTPLIEIIPKGDEQVVIDRIEEWKPYISAVNSLRLELNQSLISSVQAIDNFMKMDRYPGDDVVKYMLSKRTMYYFDKDCIGITPPAWIQYEYPPVQECLVVADILRKNSKELDTGKPGNPEEYFVILTPSCDMARPKPGETILVAHCLSPERFSNDAKLGKKEKLEDETAQRKKDNLIRSLNTGYNYAKVALPELPNKIPYMTIDLKKIETVALEEIALSEKEIEANKQYYRVASVNSPFREQIVWAHMINSCRPGMPDRDMNAWAEGVLLQ